MLLVINYIPYYVWGSSSSPLRLHPNPCKGPHYDPESEGPTHLNPSSPSVPPHSYPGDGETPLRGTKIYRTRGIPSTTPGSTVPEVQDTVFQTRSSPQEPPKIRLSVVRMQEYNLDSEACVVVLSYRFPSSTLTSPLESTSDDLIRYLDRPFVVAKTRCLFGVVRVSRITDQILVVRFTQCPAIVLPYDFFLGPEGGGPVNRDPSLIEEKIQRTDIRRPTLVSGRLRPPRTSRDLGKTSLPAPRVFDLTVESLPEYSVSYNVDLSGVLFRRK